MVSKWIAEPRFEFVYPYLIRTPADYCQLPYPGHRKGCPMFGTRDCCPPRAKRLDEVYDIYNYSGLSYVAFNLEWYAKEMKNEHPNWTEKQCKCCLYWQGSVRKVLKNFCEKVIKEMRAGDFSYEMIPEAMGLDVFKTMANLDIILERNPQKVVYKVAFIGRLKCAP